MSKDKVVAARCNYYFGGWDGGNRCQLPIGHPEGHLWEALKESAIPISRDKGLSEEELRTRLAAIIAWLEKNQPDVFRRGIWDAINMADDSAVKAARRRP
jgi:hypothetical protein